MRLKQAVHIGKADMRGVGQLLKREPVARIGRDELDELIDDLMLGVARRGELRRGLRKLLLRAAQKLDQKNFQKAFHIVAAVALLPVFLEHFPQE